MKYPTKEYSNPFLLEKIRSSLAIQNKNKRLISTYRIGFPEIPDINTNEFWNENILKRYDLVNGPMAMERIWSVYRHIKDTKGKLLDVGIGTANLEMLLQRNSLVEIYGIDISEISIKRARNCTRGTYIKGNILTLPFEDGYFDVVTALEILEHIPPTSVFQAYRELYRVLKRKGKLIVSVPLNEELEQMVNNGKNPNGHVRCYTEDLITKEIQLAHFVISEKKVLYAFPDMYLFKKLLQKTLFPNKWKPNNIVIFAQKR